MAKIDVKPDVLAQVAETESDLAKQLTRQAKSINEIKSNLSIHSSSVAQIKTALNASVKNIEEEQKKLREMASMLEAIRELYKKTEESLTTEVTGQSTLGTSGGSSDSDTSSTETQTAFGIGYVPAAFSLVSWIWGKIHSDDSDEITAYEVDSIVYGESGEYGGNQGAPQSESHGSERWQEMYDIVRNYYPDMTEDEFDTFLRRLNSEGCGYVALINTIFVYYEGRANEFEAAFGFSMYDDNGDLNFELLLVDFYADMDNTNGKGKVDQYRDYDSSVDGDKSSYDVLNDTTGDGTNISDRKKYLENYMKNHGVDVDVKKNKSVETSEIPDLLSDGKQIIVAVQGPINMYSADGSYYGTIGEGSGHAMTITGVTEDGMIIVSSWGKKYLLDPSEFSGSTKFSIIEYN